MTRFPIRAALAAGAALALAGCATTAGNPAGGAPSPTPSYNLRGFLTAADGPSVGAMRADIGQLARDASNGNPSAVLYDAHAIETDTTAVLAQLRQTNPPPAYRPARGHFIAAVVLMHRAAADMARAITSEDATAAAQANGLISQADYEIHQAAVSLP